MVCSSADVFLRRTLRRRCREKDLKDAGTLITPTLLDGEGACGVSARGAKHVSTSCVKQRALAEHVIGTAHHTDDHILYAKTKHLAKQKPHQELTL